MRVVATSQPSFATVAPNTNITNTCASIAESSRDLAVALNAAHSSSLAGQKYSKNSREIVTAWLSGS
jgi:hypothetical protein